MINQANKTIKLQKAIAMFTGLSRRQAEALIAAGKVRVNQHLAKIGQRVDPTKDKIELLNKPLNQTNQAPVYVLVYKPRQVITSRADDLGRKTIMNLLPKKYQHLFPVGRLDYDSEGLVLLTNDGQLAYRLTHPKFEIEKVYLVKPDRKLTHAAFAHLKKGMFIGKHKVVPVSLRRLPDDWLEIKITSGQKHVVRKLLKHAGYEVIRLVRIKFGPFQLDKLKPGEYRLVSSLSFKHLD